MLRRAVHCSDRERGVGVRWANLITLSLKGSDGLHQHVEDDNARKGNSGCAKIINDAFVDSGGNESSAINHNRRLLRNSVESGV